MKNFLLIYINCNYLLNIFKFIYKFYNQYQKMGVGIYGSVEYS